MTNCSQSTCCVFQLNLLFFGIDFGSSTSIFIHYLDQTPVAILVLRSTGYSPTLRIKAMTSMIQGIGSYHITYCSSLEPAMALRSESGRSSFFLTKPDSR